MKTEFTPGPWSTDGSYVLPLSDFAKAQPGTLYVALCGISSSYRPKAETEANARLVAAAPDLLDACKALIPYLQHHDYTHEGCDACAQVRAAKEAIARAEGRP